MGTPASAALSRRALLATTGAIVVNFLAEGTGRAASGAADQTPSSVSPTAARILPPDQLDSFIAVLHDGTALALYGKMDPGQGVDVAIAQIVAEELDLPVSKVQVIQGDTYFTVNQGGASGSTGIERGGKALRYAAAEARRVLVNRASSKLATPPDQLDTSDGQVYVKSTPTARVAYADLIGDGFDTKLTWNGKIGNDLFVHGPAEPKPPSHYKVVGTSVRRQDIRRNVFAQQAYVTDIRLPGMLHARMIRPPVAGAIPTTIDETSVRHIPDVRIVHQSGLLAVVAPKEWDAVRAQRALGITWSRPAEPPFPDQATLYDHIRIAPAIGQQDEVSRGDLSAVMETAAKIHSAEYEWPFQSHSSMVGACAVVDARSDSATVWTGTQKPHFAQLGVAKLLGLPPDKVRVIWTRGPGSYGRNDAGDATMDAAVISHTLGHPIRVQYMRDQGTGWDPKGPASVHLCRAGLDATGHIVAYHYVSKGFSRVDVDTSEGDPRDTLAGQMMGLGRKPTQGFGYPTEPYAYGATLIRWETIPPLLDLASPLRTAHLRDPVGPQVNFASESFIDELAALAGIDPIDFRLRHLSEPRGIAVLKAAAEKFGWQPKPAATDRDIDGDIVRGRGVAVAFRGATLVAAIVEIDLDRRTGRVHPRRWSIGHDCGQIVNPEGLRLTVEGNIVQGTSRALLEEVTFDRDNVTSIDWRTYPTLDVDLLPDRIDITLIDHPEIAPSGAGEGSTRPVAAAIANAIYDATGVRLRRAPLSPARVKAALA
jgi:nicotinate dehydrogenase subunit B